MNSWVAMNIQTFIPTLTFHLKSTRWLCNFLSNINVNKKAWSDPALKSAYDWERDRLPAARRSRLFFIKRLGIWLQMREQLFTVSPIRGISANTLKVHIRQQLKSIVLYIFAENILKLYSSCFSLDPGHLFDKN